VSDAKYGAFLSATFDRFIASSSASCTALLLNVLVSRLLDLSAQRKSGSAMGFRINRSDDPETGRVVLSAQGMLTADYADLLESECSNLLSDPAREICIDLEGLRFLDEAGAAALARLKRRPNIYLRGSELFIQQMINGTRNTSDACSQD
jgi:anti-anti-sigma regulatory factor